jgi:MFS family permease
MKQMGLSPTEMSLIFSVSTIAPTFVRAVVGMIADKFRRHKLILIVCCIVTAFLYPLLLVVPRESHASLGELSCVNGSDTELLLCKLSLGKPHVEEVLNKSMKFGSSCEIKCCSHILKTLQMFEFNNSLWTMTTDKPDDTCTTHLLSVSSVYKMDADRNFSSGVCTRYNSQQGNAGIFGSVCNLVNKHLCNLTCGNSSETSITETEEAVSKFGRTFAMIFFILFIASCFFSPTISIVDGLAYNCLGDSRMKFGRQRFWGSVGYGLFGVVSSLIMDTFQKNDADKNYTYSFIMFAVFLIVTAVIVYQIEASVEVIAGSLMSNVGKILCNLELDLLMFTAFLSGFLCSAQEGFLFWFIQSLNGPQIIMGLCGLIQCSTEIFILFFSGLIVTKLGTMNCLCAVFAAFGVRFLLYSFLGNPWCVLSVEPLHCICYGLFYPAMTIRASELTPPGMHATVQSFLGTLYMCVGEFNVCPYISKLPLRVANLSICVSCTFH